MYPSQVDNVSIAATSATAPAPRRRRVGVAAMLALALAGSATGGGVAGAMATTRWLAPSSASGAATNPQPIGLQAQAAPSNVAGAVYTAVGSSIVEITITGQVRAGMTPAGSGTGFVVAEDGLILTNYHVVAGANNVSVTFSNGTQRAATVVGTDRSNDLALLRVELPDGVPAVTLGDSDRIEVGETAIAIGSPFGLEQSVTQGIISAVNRTYTSGSQILRGLIQTDAAINPGNSGGPLLNARGEVIGVTTLIESPVRGNVGVGFAVPINVAKQRLPQLTAGANLEQGYLGITVAQRDAAANGVVIDMVDPGSGAAQAGLQAGDIIIAVNGNAIADFEALVARLAGRQPGETITVTIERNGVTRDIEVTLQARAPQVQ